ncbi:MAG TPA: flagellar biosynthetic protein FliR [Limnochordia bacterium]|nr:flagellar biosynthetic protein FliR [Limnochordia bacterium]
MISVVDFVRFSLSFIRLATFFAAAPLFGMRNVPVMVKVGLSALCALVALPPLDPLWDLGSWPVLAVLALQEVVVGLVLALAVVLVFAVVSFAGHFVDVPLGFGMASVFDPALGGQIPVFSQFYHVVAVLIFFALDAHLWLIPAVQHSFAAVPLGSAFRLEPSFALFMQLAAEIFIIGLKIALPVMATLLLTDIGLGIVIRAVPQINVFVLGFPIKIMVGMAVVLLALPAAVHLITQLFSSEGVLLRYLQELLTLGGS